MDFIQATKTCFRKYFDFKGRARRSEFWYFYLFTFLGSLVFFIVDMLVFPSARETLSSEATSGMFAKPFSTVFSFAVLIPTLAAATRRLHDIGKSGFYQLLPLVPMVLLGAVIGARSADADVPGFLFPLLILLLIVFAIVVIIMLAHDEGPGPNRFGPSPKYGGDVNVF